MEYFRIHVTYCGMTGKPVGVFGACHHLKRAGRLTAQEIQLFDDINGWFIKNLPQPPFYQKGNPQKAITWFKAVPATIEMATRLQPLLDLLSKYGVKNLVSKTDAPGCIIYEDDFQVAVV